MIESFEWDHRVTTVGVYVRQIQIEEFMDLELYMVV